MCTDLQIAPSTYYAAKKRPPSRRAVRDKELAPEITRVHLENYDVYGARKVWLQLNREGTTVGRDHIARLMRASGLVGVRRGKFHRTTITDPTAERPSDLVDRHFVADAPNRLWVPDITYVST